MRYFPERSLHREVLRDMAGLGIANVYVQKGCACVVAVYRLLDLLVPSDSDVLGVIALQPLRAERRCRDDQGA
jgi:hypothetical protein